LRFPEPPSWTHPSSSRFDALLDSGSNARIEKEA
jgi:hypothetical protein